MTSTTSGTADVRGSRLARLRERQAQLTVTARKAFLDEQSKELPAVDVVGETGRAVGSLAAVLLVLVGFAYLLGSGGGVLGFGVDLAAALRGAVWVLGLSVGSPLRVGVAETASINVRLAPLWVTLGLFAAAAVPAWRSQLKRPSTVRVAAFRALTQTGVTAFVTLFAVLLSTSKDQYGTAVGVNPLITTGGVTVVVAVATLSARVTAERRTQGLADGWLLGAVRHLGRVVGVWAVVALVAGCVEIVAQTVAHPDDSATARMFRDLALLPNLLTRLVLTGSGAPLTSRGDLGESGELFSALDLGGRTRVTLADVNPLLALLGLVLVAAGPVVVAVLRRRAGKPVATPLTHLRAGVLAAGLFAFAAWAVASVTSVSLTGGAQGDSFGLSASSASRVGIEVAAIAGLLWVGLMPALVSGLALAVRKVRGRTRAAAPVRVPRPKAAPAGAAAAVPAGATLSRRRPKA